MRARLEQELQRHAGALRALAAALVGESDADDVLQETALQSLGAPPRNAGPLGGWLAGVVRHLAWRRRRSERRRAFHEQAAARNEAQPADRCVEDRDTMRALTDAVLALPEPYRETVIQRYLRDLMPAAIARQAGVPVETVKSRLKRGLALLREHLVARGGRDWRLALGSAFGVDEPVATTTGVLMGLGAKVMFSGLAAGLALCALLLLLGDGARAPRQSTGGSARPVPEVASATRTIANDAADPGPRRVEVESPPAPQPVARIRGRCIDENGAVLSGCATELHDAALLAPAAGSGADGVFEIACAPTSARFTLRVSAAHRSAFTARWSGITAGQTIDVGDVRMPVVREVRLHTVDTRGRPVARAWIWPHSNEEPSGDGLMRTDDAGFASVQLPPGPWYLTTIPPALYEYAVIPRGKGPCDVVLTLGSPCDSIEGLVVDEQGTPVHRALVSAHEAMCRTGPDGVFALARADGVVATAAIRVMATGFEEIAVDAVAWNTQGLRIVLRTGKTVAVRVTRPDGTPVQEFKAHLLGARGGWWSRCRAEGSFPDGVATLTGASRGPAQLLVVPKDTSLGSCLFQSCTIADAADNQVDVTLPAFGSKQLRLEYTDGSPAPGIAFELIQALQGRKPHVDSWVRRFDVEPGQLATGDGLLLQSGTTNGDGGAELRGPVDETLFLRVLSGEKRLVDLRLCDPGPLVVQLPPAGAVRGRIGPPILMHRLRAMRRAEGPRMLLRSDSRTLLCPVADDGSFELGNIPPGTWRLILQLEDGFGHIGALDVGTLAVEAGRVTVQDFDLSHVTPGEVHAVVTLDGEPLAGREVVLVDVAAKRHDRLTARGTTSADGRLQLCALAATYRVSLSMSVSLELPAPITVTGGQIVTARFAFVSSRVRLRVLDPRGQPMPGLRLEYDDAKGATQRLGPTDLDGRIALRIAPGTYRVFAWRSDLLANPAFLRTSPTAEQRAKARFEIGRLELQPGQVVERELRLPDEWDR